MKVQMNEIKLGDRVVMIMSDHKIPKGMEGTVRHIDDDVIGVEWDFYIEGHNGNGAYIGKSGYCWNVYYTNVNVINDQPFKIKWYSKGRFSKWEDN